jgi:hypothetical protein
MILVLTAAVRAIVTVIVRKAEDANMILHVNTITILMALQETANATLEK